MQAYFETSDGILINYIVHCIGKTPLVMLHGWGGQQIALNSLINELKGDYTVVTFDLRGFGKSDRPSKGYSIERLATDIKELLEHLDLKDVVLLGWSMGGVASSYYVDMFGTDRLSKLILVDVNTRILSDESYSHGFYDGNYTKVECFDDIVKMAKDFRLFAEEMPEKGNMILFDEAMKKAFVEKVIDQNPDPTPCISLWAALSVADLTEIYKRFELPVLFCHGGVSTYCPAAACKHIAGLIKNITVAEFPECSHFIPIEKPKDMAEAIDTFINK
ncbi:MAG: alpha/beta hydrolase [Lachnospiraceae bacterium]|nr:alpha/beta hydrolase [Lachnospiraceae bacterium]